MKKFIKIWLLTASRVAQIQLLTGWGSFLFLFGKLTRFFLFFIFIFSVLSKTGVLVGYSQKQVILFFLVFNLVDISVQAFFRGVYRFRRQIITGDYDLELLRPLPSFFRPIFGWTDILDIITLFPLWVYFFIFVLRNNLFANIESFVIFVLLFFNSLVLGFSFHLFICSICVLTTEIDHLVWVYRDITNMGRFPADIYSKGVQFFLTFFVPVVILFTIPTKALIGLLSFWGVFFAVLLTLLFFFASLKFWKCALKNYASASS